MLAHDVDMTARGDSTGPSGMPVDTRTSRGFTLVEVVIVVLILGILAAVAAPRFAGALHRARAEEAAKRIQVDLGYAREKAISSSSPLTVSFTPLTDDYTIPVLADLNRPGRQYAVALNSSPYNAALVSATLGGDGDVQFDRYGIPDSGGTITVESGGYQQTVTVNADTGKATIP